MAGTETKVDDNLVSLTSRLKLGFRSYCSKQPFPSFYSKHSLPFELQELVLAHLSALKLAELKAVSKSWRDLLQSPRFKEKWQLIRAGRSSEILDVWVMKSTNEQEDLMAYIPAMKKYSLFLPLLCNRLVMTTPSASLELKKKKLLCGSGPLLVLGDKDWQSKPLFLVYNMETHQSVQLPMLRLHTENNYGEYFSRILQPPVLIAADDYHQFSLVLETQRVYRDWSHPSYELCAFKSMTPTWNFCPQDLAVEVDSLPVNSILGGDFFHYNADDSILYTFGIEYWHKVSVTGRPFPMRGRNSREARASKVFKCGGHVLLVSPTLQSVQGIVLQGFIIWSLVKEEESWYWVEMSRTPHELCLKSYNEESLSDATFMGDGCCICALSSSHEFFPPLVYDVEHDSWYHLDGVLKNMQALFSMKLILNIGKL